MIIITLFVTYITITLGVVISLGIMALILVKGLKKVLEGYGNDRRTYSAGMLKCMQQAFGGIKEIKIANREEYFEQDFEKQNEIYTYVIKQNAFLSSLPKPIIEALAITGLMAMIIVKIAAGNTDSQHFIVVLGVFAVAAFKLLPSVNKISSYYAAIIHNGVVIEKIRDEYKEIAANKEKMEEKKAKKENGKEISLEKEIRVEHMEFTYPNVDEPVLKDVNVSIPKNASVAFIGPSGAGKTTFVDLILGVLTPQKGVIKADDTDIQTALRGWHDKIGYIPQTIYMLDDTIRNNIAFGAKENIDDNRIWEALKQAQLDEFVKEMEDGLDTVIGEAGVRISGGQRQRIGIARTLALRPEFIVCDEPISALDVSIQAQVINLLEKLQREKGFSYLFIAHDLEMVHHISHKIGVMYLGNMVELGSSDDVYKKPLHPYTRALISAAPIADPKMAKEKKRIILEGEVPSPINPPKGCPFAGRCKYATEECKSKKPDTYMYDNRQVACNLYSPKNLAQYKAVGKTVEQIIA